MPIITPLDSPKLSVALLLKQPLLISRSLSSMIYQRLVADRLFAIGSPEQVAGGAVRYQKSETIFPNRNPLEMSQRSEFIRAGWDETVLTEAVKQYGLAVPISGLMIRRNQMDMVRRGMLKLSNQITKFIDTKAMAVLIAAAVAESNQFAAAAVWAPGADIYADLVNAKGRIEDANEGYIADTLLIPPVLRDKILNNTGIRAMMPREGGNTTPQTGALPGILGFENIWVTNALASTNAVVASQGIVGTIADETPNAEEGFSGFTPQPPFRTVWVKIDKDQEDFVVKAARWPAIYAAEPKAVASITGA